jgi:hypothetical protein
MTLDGVNDYFIILYTFSRKQFIEQEICTHHKMLILMLTTFWLVQNIFRSCVNLKNVKWNNLCLLIVISVLCIKSAINECQGNVIRKGNVHISTLVTKCINLRWAHNLWWIEMYLILINILNSVVAIVFLDDIDWTYLQAWSSLVYFFMQNYVLKLNRTRSYACSAKKVQLHSNSSVGK